MTDRLSVTFVFFCEFLRSPLVLIIKKITLGPMDASNGILCPVPEDERTPFVDVLLKFIDWQKVCIENVEEENKRLKKEIAELNKQGVDERKREALNSAPRKNIKRRAKQKKNIPRLKVQKQGAVRPENVQQLLVKNIQQLLVNIGNKNRRQFTRLHIHLDAELDFGSQRYYRYSVGNISLGGLYVNGDFSQCSGDICTVTLNHSELEEALEVHATCSVITSNEHGASLEFISMKLDDFCHLQTLLLYQADDPVILGTEFVNNMHLELEGDLILCKAFHFRRDKEEDNEMPTV
ncbi:MAG: hypothetical protein D3910_09435 [Candidatus Electrothrix sp. ATG2]|nr:hypothetical protein [Candidatus Electrothrix sp. ATG2]